MTNVEIIEALKGMTIIELNDLVKAIEQEFGVTAAAAVAAAPAEEEKKEEKTDFDIVLTSFGANKLSVIKIVKEITGLGLKESKDLVDAAASGPSKIKENVAKADAEAVKEKLEAAGAKVELK